eukprot:g5327.t1
MYEGVAFALGYRGEDGVSASAWGKFALSNGTHRREESGALAGALLQASAQLKDVTVASGVLLAALQRRGVAEVQHQDLPKDALLDALRPQHKDVAMWLLESKGLRLESEAQLSVLLAVQSGMQSQWQAFVSDAACLEVVRKLVSENDSLRSETLTTDMLVSALTPERYTVAAWMMKEAPDAVVSALTDERCQQLWDTEKWHALVGALPKAAAVVTAVAAKSIVLAQQTASAEMLQWLFRKDQAEACATLLENQAKALLTPDTLCTALSAGAYKVAAWMLDQQDGTGGTLLPLSAEQCAGLCDESGVWGSVVANLSESVAAACGVLTLPSVMGNEALAARMLAPVMALQPEESLPLVDALVLSSGTNSGAWCQRLRNAYGSDSHPDAWEQLLQCMPQSEAAVRTLLSSEGEGYALSQRTLQPATLVWLLKEKAWEACALLLARDGDEGTCALTGRVEREPLLTDKVEAWLLDRRTKPNWEGLVSHVIQMPDARCSTFVELAKTLSGKLRSSAAAVAERVFKRVANLSLTDSTNAVAAVSDNAAVHFDADRCLP